MLSKTDAKIVLNEIMNLYPEARPTMRYENAFQLLMVVILSAQATDASIEKIQDKLFERYPSPESVVESSIEEIETYINTIGLYHNKARYIFMSSQQLLDNFGGEVPSTRKELTSLTGIGPKSANIILSVAYGEAAFAVDTHVTRICKHHNIVDDDATAQDIEKRVTEILPPEKWGHAHQAMINFGREICKPRKPLCENHPQLYVHLG